MDKLPFRQVHLDFHTSESIKKIGASFSKEQFKKCLQKGHVNSITIFAKCHHGWAYFPSEKNTMHPGLNFDLLSAQLEACNEAGVAAPIYISAGFDQKYAVEHPDHLHAWSKEWKPCKVNTNSDGYKYFERVGVQYDLLCMNSPYLDVLASQVEEVVRKFMPVGIFLDIVAPRPCWCKHCTELMEKQGLDPESREDRVKFGEITYKKYYDTVNNIAKSIKPDIRIFHNGGHIACGRRDLAYANTHLELESLPTGGWGYDHFPKSARYVQNLGQEYLGMTGKFHLSWGEFGGFKHPNALRYEVALSLANGAKISVGDQMHPDCFLDDATYELIGNAFSYAESVEEFCHDVTSVADIGLISVEAVTNGVEVNSDSDVGACRILLEGNYLYDILDLECDFNKYKLLILPDKIKISQPLAEKLNSYVKNGGKVLCTGCSGTDENNNFVFDFGIKYVGKSIYKPTYYRPDNYDALGLSTTSFVMYSPMYTVIESGTTANILGFSRIPPFNRAAEHYCSHQHTPYIDKDSSIGAVIGKDGGYIAWEVFSEYAQVGSIILKDTVKHVIDELLLDNKTLETNLPAQGVVTLNNQESNNRHVLHLLYATPTKRGKNTEIIEDLIPLHDTNIMLKLDKPVTSVTLYPENASIPFEYNNGMCKFKIDKFTGSTVVVIGH